MWEMAPRLCWGDSRISNMIFQDAKCVAVIDWEMASLGNPVESASERERGWKEDH